jgi:hypothetical protein
MGLTRSMVVVATNLLVAMERHGSCTLIIDRISWIILLSMSCKVAGRMGGDMWLEIKRSL